MYKRQRLPRAFSVPHLNPSLLNLILLRRHTGGLLEQHEEILLIFDPNLPGHVLDLHAGIPKDLLSPGDAQLIDVIGEGAALGLAEDAAQVCGGQDVYKRQV